MRDVKPEERRRLAEGARALLPFDGAGEAVAAIMAMSPGARALLLRKVPGLGGPARADGADGALAAVSGVVAGRLALAPDGDRMGVLALRPAAPGEAPADLASVLAAIRANSASDGRLLEAAEARRGGDA